MSTLGIVQALLKARFRLAAEAVAPDSPLETFALDTLAMIEVLCLLEGEFRVAVPTSRTVRLPVRTVGELADYVDCLLAAQPREPGQAGAPQAPSLSASRPPGDGSRRDAFARPRARRG